jgi:ribulose-5-phosphate 4-epimerase/fuculose-1-phosphate aldolase
MTVKFNIIFTERTIPRDSRLDELRYWCQEFQRLNLTPRYQNRSLGNLSFRLNQDEDDFMITASALEVKDSLSDDSFVIVHSYDAESRTIRASGTREPSSESVLHFGVYAARRDTNAVFHGHSGRIIRASDALGLTTTTKFEDYGSLELATSVLDVLDDQSFIVMKKHGFLSLGQTMKEAGTLAIEIYERARLCESAEKENYRA